MAEAKQRLQQIPTTAQAHTMDRAVVVLARQSLMRVANAPSNAE
jgi:hypothetical protein